MSLPCPPTNATLGQLQLHSKASSAAVVSPLLALHLAADVHDMRGVAMPSRDAGTGGHATIFQLQMRRMGQVDRGRGPTFPSCLKARDPLPSAVQLIGGGGEDADDRGGRVVLAGSAAVEPQPTEPDDQAARREQQDTGQALSFPAH
eukprot:2943560-Rhodomonas_salina.2